MVAAGSNNAFAINGFTGLTNPQIFSFLFVFILFNFYVVLMATALASFYLTSKPRHGRVRSAAIWHFAAACVLIFSFITTVWGAPAEKAFVDPTGQSLSLSQSANITVAGLGIGRAGMMFVGMFFAVVAMNLMLMGFIQGARQRRTLRDRALVSA
jgi:hypothetical protein